MKFPRLNVNPRDMSFLGTGSDGIVYRISDDKAAKFELSRGWLGPVSSTGKGVQREYEIARELYDNGISVPEPFGVFSLPQPKDVDWGILPGWIGLNRFPAFVMKYIEQTVESIGTPKIRPKLMEEELEKAKSLRFIPIDCGLSNTLWSESDKRVYLIDFADWRKRNE